MNSTRSELAIPWKLQRDVKDRTAPVYGIIIHTTGNVLEKAKRKGLDPLTYVCGNIYSTPPNNFPHYVIGHEGKIIQIADERERAWHAGIDKSDLEKYESGKWRFEVKRIDLWFVRWPGFKSPLDLFPGHNPNNVYLGIELLADPPLAKPNNFSWAQYDSLIGLCADIAKRHNLPLLEGSGQRLVFHEDIEPLQRFNNKGGWDPGARREIPHFNEVKLHEGLMKLV